MFFNCALEIQVISETIVKTTVQELFVKQLTGSLFWLDMYI